jgi:hypothetical protein
MLVGQVAVITEIRNAHGILSGKPKDKAHFRDIAAHGGKILRYILNQSDVKA